MLSENELYKQIRVQNNRASDREKKVGTRVLHSHPSRMVYLVRVVCDPGNQGRHGERQRGRNEETKVT